jgi:hypothetical protein
MAFPGSNDVMFKHEWPPRLALVAFGFCSDTRARLRASDPGQSCRSFNVFVSSCLKLIAVTSIVVGDECTNRAICGHTYMHEAGPQVPLFAFPACGQSNDPMNMVRGRFNAAMDLFSGHFGPARCKSFARLSECIGH